MATDFFERQASARRSTVWLIGMFALAAIAIVGTVYVAAYMVVAAEHDQHQYTAQYVGEPIPNEIPIFCALGAAVLIVGGSLYKVAMLRAGGGQGVAESLGGKRLFPDTSDPDERKVLNIVEEMAIASGTPAPPVYLMDEAGINAFAAGYTPSDAVVGVTRGAINSLSRDELQGVIAHEFSHILNGDMRMSIRMIGVLHGILLLGLIGQILLRVVFYSGNTYDSRRSGSDGSGKGGGGIIAVLAVAIVLILIGSIGSLIGGLIKAAVSRQREYLADASAVQFTRNPGGIAGALKRIGGAPRASRIRHPRASELSHMYFTQGVWEGFTSLMATHPPLDRRIIALEPDWDGKFLKGVGAVYPEAVAQASGFAGGPAGGAAAMATDTGMLEAVDRAVDQVGEPDQRHRDYAAAIIDTIPAGVLEAVREPYGARAVIYGLLLDKERTVRQKQYDQLRELAEGDVVRLMLKLLPEIDEIEPRLRLPLIDMALPSLAALSKSQYKKFALSFRALVLADDRLSLFEWMLSQVLMRHLRPRFEKVRTPMVEQFYLSKLGKECSIVLSALAWSGHDPQQAEKAFKKAWKVLKEVNLEFLPQEACGLNHLRTALEELTKVTAKHRGRLIDASAEIILADGRVSVAEAELLRGVSDLLDCPMPPILPE